MTKKSFSILELILVILLLTIVYTFFIPQYKINKLNELTNRLELYLSYVRLKALVDNQYDDNSLWHKKRWTLKFFNCRSDVGGIYFSIYSDENLTGIPSASDSMKDPLTNKNIYSSNFCSETNENSKYVLLTKNYDIKDIKVSCNETTTLGQISFGSDGKVYSKLSNEENSSKDFEIKEPCSIKFIDKNENFREILVFPTTSFSKKH